MHVLFLEPSFPKNQREFVRGLKMAGAYVTGIGETPADSLSPEVTRWLDGYEHVRSVTDEKALLECVQRIQARGWVDRFEATVEAHVMAAAHVREVTDIPGTTAHTAWLCRDKPAMKDELRRAGVPCAQSTGAKSAAEVVTFAERVGYPLILKPTAGAGAAGATRVDNRADLDAAITKLGVDKGATIAVEEFIAGHEGFYDTLTCAGKVVFDFASHYYPNVLEAMRTRWISPQIVVTNRLDSAKGYGEVKAMGRKVIETLGIWTSATHMEWFFGDKGLRFSEIGCRPPGVGLWDMYAAANEIDIFHEWGKLIVNGHTEGRLSRRYAAGMVALRPDRDGRLTSVEGIDRMRRKFAQWWIDDHVPLVGTPTQGVEAGYMANAWVRLRHPDYDELRKMLDEVGETVKLRAG